MLRSFLLRRGTRETRLGLAVAVTTNLQDLILRQKLHEKITVAVTASCFWSLQKNYPKNKLFDHCIRVVILHIQVGHAGFTSPLDHCKLPMSTMRKASDTAMLSRP